MPIINNQYHKLRAKVALVTLVTPTKGKCGYDYVATRLYDPATGAVTDERLEFYADEILPKEYFIQDSAAWDELPMLDTSTKRLVGRNKERYCTVISARVFKLRRVRDFDGMDIFANASDYSGIYGYLHSESQGETVYLRVLGYTFIDINGDKIYKTARQVRESNILEHVHSMEVMSEGGMYKRKVGLPHQNSQTLVPTMELDDTDTTLEDEELREYSAAQLLIGGWSGKNSDGALTVNADILRDLQLEELDIPEGITSIPPRVFTPDATMRQFAVKRIKLPKSLRAIGECAFRGLARLEEISIPESVKFIGENAFSSCTKLKELDLRHLTRVPQLTEKTLQIEHLILPDILQYVSLAGLRVNVLEFCNTTGAKRRVISAEDDATSDYRAHNGALVNRIETNGPVVLGKYAAEIVCADVSALEPNIIGVAKGSRFLKSAAGDNQLPWKLGPATEFVYAPYWSYQFTAEACASGNCKAVTLNNRLPAAELPKGLVLLQGTAPQEMLQYEYPSVKYAVCNVFGATKVRVWCKPTEYGYVSTAPFKWSLLRFKVPALQWLLPREANHTLEQVRRLEHDLAPIKYEIRAELMQILALNASNAYEAKCGLLSGLYSADVKRELDRMFTKYSMLYLGD